MKVYTLRSFAAKETGGNPAGVVLDADDLSDEERKSIAAQVGFSETAFVEKSDVADFKVRFFTPIEEVDLCGHATIATYSLLFRKGLLAAGKYTQELQAGILHVSISNDGFVMMEQLPPVFSEYIEPEKIREIVGKEISFDTFKPQIVSTGLRDILLPVADRKTLFSLRPDLEKLSQLNKETNSIGLHAFTMDTIHAGSIAHSRNFAPLYGIPEESATGSSTGALARYLFQSGMLKGRGAEMMRFEQGYSMNQPSEIFVILNINGNKVDEVWVGGRTVLTGEIDAA